MPLSHTRSANSFLSLPTAENVSASPSHAEHAPNATALALQIAVASITVHLLAIAWFGTGVPAPRVPRPAEVVPPPTAATVENVQLAPELPPPPPEPVVQELTPAPDAPPSVPDVTLPPLPALQPISAVAPSVPVAFGLHVDGPVRLVRDAAHASGSAGDRRLTEPVALDVQGEQDLVLPSLRYPVRAKHQRLTGTAVLEFKTTPTGEISDVRVRVSSGHPILDEAATENLREGRWKGRPGYYLKAFEFTLQ